MRLHPIPRQSSQTQQFLFISAMSLNSLAEG